jgi:Tat protein translocase TatB subunit
MFDIGMTELMVIFVVALLVLGPKKLPELGRALGKGLGELKKALQDVKDSVGEEITEAAADIRDTVKDVKKEIELGAQETKKTVDDAMKEVSDQIEKDADEINRSFDGNEGEGNTEAKGGK